jgi:adenosylhomocysteine nucleosidase
METIGLIAAMPQESKALLRYTKGWKRFPIGAFRGFSFTINDRICFLVTSGMGILKAAHATRALLTITKPDLLISFGIAGAVNEDLNIGDVIAPENTCLFSKGILEQLQPLTQLSKKAWDAASQVLQLDGSRLVSGTAITTRGSQVVREDCEELNNPILEMETAGIAQVAGEMKIPLLLFRSISDGPRSPIPFNLERIMDVNGNIQIIELFKLIINHPQITFKSRLLLQNSSKAADHAARALFAALNQPSPLTFS